MLIETPSELFPAPPALRLTLPDGWEPFASAVATLSASDPASPPSFRANVVVIVSKAVHEHAVSAVAQLLIDKTHTDHPGASVLSSTACTVADLDGYVSTVVFQPEQAEFPVAQVQGVVIAPTAHPEVRYAVQFHGTCARDDLATYEPILTAAFTSLAVT